MYLVSTAAELASYLPHFLVTSIPSESKNLALQPPQKSDTHFASGKPGHLVTSHGSAKQLTTGTPLGQGGPGGGGPIDNICNIVSKVELC